MNRKIIVYVAGALLVLGAFGWFFYYVFVASSIKFSPGGGVGSEIWWVIAVLAVAGLVLLFLNRAKRAS